MLLLLKLSTLKIIQQLIILKKKQSNSTKMKSFKKQFEMTTLEITPIGNSDCGDSNGSNSREILKYK